MMQSGRSVTGRFCNLADCPRMSSVDVKVCRSGKMLSELSIIGADVVGGWLQTAKLFDNCKVDFDLGDFDVQWAVQCTCNRRVRRFQVTSRLTSLVA